MSKRKSTTPANLASKTSALTQEQLRTVLATFFEEKHPELKDEFVALLPKPDTQAIFKDIDVAQRAYEKAFPHNKFGSNDDTYAYNRVKSPLNTFKKLLCDGGTPFKESGDWESLLAYAVRAMSYATSMPTWKDAAHNKSRESTIKKIHTFAKDAIKNGEIDEQTALDMLERYKASFDEDDVYVKEISAVIDKKKATGAKRAKK